VEIDNYTDTIEHDWRLEYTYNTYYHWHNCNVCDKIKDRVDHTINNGVCIICGGENLTSEGVVYEISGGYASVVGYTGTDTNVKIAKFYQGVPVRTIRSYAFYGHFSLVSVEIPDSVTTIESQAFYYCDRLLYVVIPNSVRNIDSESIYSVFANLNTIYYTGTEEDWNDINIDSNNWGINHATIYYYKDDEPALNIEGTAYNDFYWKYDKNGERYIWSYYTEGATEGVEYEVSSDGTFAEVVGYHGIATTVKIADFYNGLPVKGIRTRAFYDKMDIIAVEIPNSVTSIGDYAFASCEMLKTIKLPEQLDTIGDSAFSGCNNLVNLELPSGLKKLVLQLFLGV
jgi:hypothetical protein